MFVPALAYPHEQSLVASGVLSRHQPYPSSQMPTVLEFPAVANGGNDSGRRFWANLANACDPAAILIGFEDRVDPAIKGRDPPHNHTNAVKRMCNPTFSFLGEVGQGAGASYSAKMNLVEYTSYENGGPCKGPAVHCQIASEA